MPAYEGVMLLRAVPKPELVTILKRLSTVILSRKGILRSIENMGCHPTPYKMSEKGSVHRKANFFIFHFDIAVPGLLDLHEEFDRDMDVVKKSFYKKFEENPSFECLIDEETQPPAYRKDVQKMLKQSKKQQNPYTHVFKYNSGLSYYPFQK